MNKAFKHWRTLIGATVSAISYSQLSLDLDLGTALGIAFDLITGFAAVAIIQIEMIKRGIREYRAGR